MRAHSQPSVMVKGLPCGAEQSLSPERLDFEVLPHGPTRDAAVHRRFLNSLPIGWQRIASMSLVSGSAASVGEVRPFPKERYSDAELVLALARGEKEALRVIWNRHGDSVRAALHAALGADAAVDDLAQEVFLSLYRGIRRLRDPAALRAYLLGSAVRSAAFERRTRARRARWMGILALEPNVGRVKLPNVEERDALRVLRAILDSVSERPRMAFILRYVNELSPAEVAVALGVSEATAKRAIARGRERVALLARREPALSGYVSATGGHEHEPT